MRKDGDEMKRETSPMSSLWRASFIDMAGLLLSQGGQETPSPTSSVPRIA